MERILGMKVLNISGSPSSLEECFAELERSLPKEELDRIRSIPEEKMCLYHSNLGRKLRNEWGTVDGIETTGVLP